MNPLAAPESPTLQDVERAFVRIRSRVRRTPLLRADAGLFGVKAPVLKLESLQATGSFKARGAMNGCLALGDRLAAGVVTASGGNHGQAIAWAAKALGARATIFVPERTPPAKIAGIRRHGADLRVQGGSYPEAAALAVAFGAETGAQYVHAYDEAPVVAGQGTTGLELLEQLDELGETVDTVLVAVGGGGLASGIALAGNGRYRVVAVEPANCPTWFQARAAGEPVDVAPSGVAADSLGTTRLGAIAFDVLTASGAGAVLVDDEAIGEARRLLWEQYRLVAEHGGAAAAAALLSGAYVPENDERVAVLICGSNTDPSDLLGLSG